MTETSSSTSVFRSIALAALLISLGNVASRVLGLVREPIIAAYFSRGLEVDAFTLAWTLPNALYELLISGAVSAALVPVFSEYAERDRDEFWHVVSTVITLAFTMLVIASALLAWQAPLAVALLARPTESALQAEAVALVGWLLPAVTLMGLSGIVTAVLHAQRRFLLPAFVAAAFNTGMIIGIVTLAPLVGIKSLAAGTLLGASAQLLIQLPGLRDAKLRIRFDLRHPAVRRILRLYAPVTLGIGFSLIGAVIDRWLASGFLAALSTMRFATTLIQFPLGLVASAVALAVLPTLSRQSAAGDEPAFRATLAMGIKIVLLLILPATAGLAALSQPITATLFERGAFGAEDTAITALALLGYLPGLPAAAIDQMLLFAFYARKNTLTPNLIQGAAILCYLAVAVPLAEWTSLGFLGLVLGNSAQWIGHAIITAWLLQRSLPLGGLRLGEATAKGMIASGIMALAVSGIATLGQSWPPLAQVAVAGSTGIAIYTLLAIALRLEAATFLLNIIRTRLGRTPSS
ncbi:murein biosynthesis integral membrane protein MurJ [uncultured Chloroflexus sp.]|uniref:murein biosynthesis integral membrane protein MurJ n=1 Tax=uncultured Chloroflexus sp. TaxID=214040 RepID=UPI0026118FE7|nr:murein biosynthesis integral membrane protein MurJ [uncultured Chloroflexus sp.]